MWPASNGLVTPEILNEQVKDKKLGQSSIVVNNFWEKTKWQISKMYSALETWTELYSCQELSRKD